MRFAAPWGLAAAALGLPLTLWYVLRARRPRVEVSSTYLWRQTERSVAAAVPWQRFRPDRTYWLVLLAIVAGALALARPTIAAPAELGDHTIIMIDTSASMLADEQGPTRLELARRAARELAGRMSGAQTVSVVEAGSRARVVLAASGDAGAAWRSLGQLQPGGGGADLADAFTLAASLQRPGEQTVTHLFTDGPILESVLGLAPPGLVVNGVGSDRPNLAVSRLQPLPGSGGGGQAFVQVRNLGQLATPAVLTVTMDGHEVARRDLELAPRGSQDLIVETGVAGSADNGVLRATVAPKGSDAGGGISADALALDDTAVAVVTGPRVVRALVAGPGNVFVESALEAVEGVEVTTAERVPADLSAVDLLVVDRIFAPVAPTVPTLYIAPRRPPSDVTLGAPLELPVVTFTDTAAELLADVDLAGTAIATAQSVDAPTLQTLASGPDGPLLLAGRLSGTPVVYLPFALNDSNLPLQVAWPVLMANTVTWLAGPPTATPVTAGSVATVPVAQGVTGVEVTAPGGEAQRVDPLRPQVRVDSPGAWKVTYTGAEEEVAPATIAVNVDPAESDLARGRPKPLEAPGRRSGVAPGAPAQGRRSLAHYALVAVLVLLVVEWLGRDQPRRRSDTSAVGDRGTVRARRRLRRSRSRRPALRVARVLRTTAVAALVLALAGPQWQAAGSDVDVAFLVDDSDSLSGEGREQAQAWVRQALAARGDGDRAALALFGRDARLEYTLRGEGASADTAVVVDPSATDLSRAVRLGQGVLGSTHRRRAILLTDGKETDGDVLAGVQELAEAGVAVDVVLLDDAGRSDVLVEAVEAPARVRQGEAYDVVVSIRNTGAGGAEGILTLFADGDRVARRRVTAAPGVTDLTFRHTAEATGTVRYEALLESGGSHVAANDRGRTAVQVEGPPKVLIYERTQGLGDDLARALRAAGLPVDLQNAGTATLPGFDELLDYDGVVLVDVPASTLGEDGMVALDTYVREAGRGLIAIGGEQSFGMGGYDGTAIEELLPVFARVTDPKKRQSVAEALVVDTSGSMAACHCADDSLGPRAPQQEGVRKTDIAKEAIAKAVEQLEDQDQLGVLAFNTASNWVIPLQHLPAEAVVDDGLAKLNPNGNTDITQGVREAIAGLRDAEARLRHIVLFSDGFMEDTSGLIDVAREAADAGITLSVVGTGEGSADVLRRMAAVGGGRYYPGRDLSSIPTIIALELRMAARPIVNEGTFFPTVTAQTPVTEQLDESPPLAGYLATTAKPTAQTMLAIGEERDPLLTTWRAGLGTAVAWTSDVAPRWSAQWVTWDRFSGFWADVVNSAFPDRRETAMSLEATATPDGVAVTLELAEEIPAGATAQVTVTTPDGRHVETTLERTAADTFSGTVPASGGEGVYAIAGTVSEGDEVLHRDVVTATRSYPAEYSGTVADPARLRQLADATGGRFDPAPAAAFDRAGLAPGSVPRPLWPWLTLLALLLAPADVGLRRLRLERADWGRAVAWVRGARRRRSPVQPERDAATEALFVARARARGETSSQPPPGSGRESDDDMAQGPA